MIMIKYGKEEHLRQIVDGYIRFAPSQKYIEQELYLHDKGQGDLLEGKMKIHINGARFCDPDTDEVVKILPQGITTISIQDVSNMPIFCVSCYDKQDFSETQAPFLVRLSDEHIEGIKNDFSDATHGLIILEPERFIKDIHSIPDHQFADGAIHYFDYDKNPIEMFKFLCTGNPDVKTNQQISMTYENRYRHLLCKDKDFANQKEYRFICLDELVTKPVFYPINFTSAYKIVAIDELKKGVDIRK